MSQKICLPAGMCTLSGQFSGKYSAERFAKILELFLSANLLITVIALQCPSHYLSQFWSFPESLKDLVRFLRRDDTTCEIRRQLGYSEVLQNVCSF